MKIHNIAQCSSEWFEIKKAKMSASNAQAIGANGKGLETYILELMSEYYSSAEKEHYTNEHLERGIELESQARDIYSLKTGNEIVQVGFVELDEYTGASPDGLIGEDGLVEIKCPSDKVYFKILLDRKIDSGYVWQVQMQMLVTGREWCSLVFYNPNFTESMIIERIELDPVAQEKLKIGIANGKEQIKSIKEKML